MLCWFPSCLGPSTPSTSLLVKSHQSRCRIIPPFVQSVGIRFKADVVTFVSKDRKGRVWEALSCWRPLLISWIGGDPKGSWGSFAPGVPTLILSALLHSTSLDGIQMSLHNLLFADILSSILIQFFLNTAGSLNRSAISIQKFVPTEICLATKEN